MLQRRIGGMAWGGLSGWRAALGALALALTLVAATDTYAEDNIVDSCAGSDCTISGGDLNTASGALSTVAGGNLNQALADWATVSGGGNNRASGQFATVGGGESQVASGSRATIGGGEGNQATAPYATIAGGGSTSPGDPGTANRATNNYATIGGGGNNRANGNSATIAGGGSNVASGFGSAVGGGGSNVAGTNSFSTVGGGSTNVASGLFATVPGGVNNLAQGHYSFAAGQRAKAQAQGGFVWADSQPFDFPIATANRFDARSTGGVRFVTAVNASTGAPTAGVRVPPGGSAWATVSDRAMKINVRDVDGREVLERLVQMPVQRWSYAAQGPSVLHLGPMAQDFAAAFGLGEDDLHISTVDADGVALAAIQGLHQVVQDKVARIAALEVQNGALEARLASLEAGAPTGAAPAPPLAAGGLPTLLAGMLLGGVLVGGGLLGGVVLAPRLHRGARR